MENLTDRSKADALAVGAIELARGILADKDQRTGKGPADYIAETGSQEMSTPAEGATINGNLVDLQGRFNLNNLANGLPHQAQQLVAFKQLLENLNLEPSLADNLVQWIDSDPGNTTADLYYLGLDPPRRAAKQRVTDVAELARVKGFDADTLAKLTPYVTALPCLVTPNCESALNVNTATAQVIAAVFAMPANTAATIVETRKKKAFASKNDFTILWAPPTPAAANAINFDIKSDFFLTTVKVTSGRVQAGYSALLTTIPGATPGGSNWPGIIWVKEVAT
jgi:general secretion pathway protein K